MRNTNLLVCVVVVLTLRVDWTLGSVFTFLRDGGSMAYPFDEFDSNNMIYVGSAHGGNKLHLMDGSPGAAVFSHRVKLPNFMGSFATLSFPQTTQNYSAGEGFGIFFSKSVPENFPSPTFLGLGNTPNVSLFAYLFSERNYYFCQWNDPIENATSGSDFMQYCSIVIFNVSASNDIGVEHFLSLQLSTSVGYSPLLKFNLFGQPIYTGFTAFNGQNTDLKITVDSWTLVNDGEGLFDYETFIGGKNTDAMRLLGDAQFEDGIYKFNRNELVGAITWPTVAWPFPKFTSSFEFRINCESEIAAGGWLFYVSSEDAQVTDDSSSFDLLQTPNVVTVGYSAVHRSFLMCIWKNAPLLSYPPESCSFVPQDSFEFMCGRNYTAAIHYSSLSWLTLVLDNNVVMRSKMAIRPHINPSDLLIRAGLVFSPHFTTSNTSFDLFKWSMFSGQQVTVPDYDCTCPAELAPSSVVTPPTSSAPAVPGIVLLGTATRINEPPGFRLTVGAGESGAVFHEEPIRVGVYFKSSFTWTVTNCDALNNGADGFSFFFTTAPPTNTDVYNSPGNSLGIMSVPNVKMIGYSSVHNVVRVCNWTTPYAAFDGICTSVYLPHRYTCDSSTNVKVVAMDSNLRIYFNDTLMASKPMEFDSEALYYYGISGSTGGGWFQQDITNWVKETIVTTVIV